MACTSLTTLSRECGKNAKAGVSSDVYLIAYSDLKPVSGSTEVYATSASGMVNQIALASGTTKFVKYGTVVNQAGIQENYTANDDASYSIEQTVTFTLNNVGSVEAKKAVENLISNPVAALVQLKNKTWLAFGLNGLMLQTGVAATVNQTANNRVITLTGESDSFIHVVDPTIISGLI